MHGLDLLLALGSGIFEGLVLVLDALNLAFHFLLPVVPQVDLTLLVVSLELADFLEFGFFLHFEEGLFDRLSQQDVEDGLDFAVVIEEIVVLDLGDLIDTCFLGDILGRLRTGNEHVSLHFAFNLSRLCSALLSQEVCQVDINAGRGARSEVIRGWLMLLTFVGQKLGLDHLNFLSLLLLFDSEFVFLLGSHVRLDQVHIVGVASENALVVHNVEGLSIFGVLIVKEAIRALCLGLILGFLAEYLRLGTFESL
jgi:hypothetical protein